MSEAIKHECGVAIVRLLKPLKYYKEKYGSISYGLNILYLLMEKQHNRGQEGAGMACVKFESLPGEEYLFRERALGSGAISEIYGTIQHNISDHIKSGRSERTTPFIGSTYLGHLRYSTSGQSGLTYVQPFLRRNNWRTRNLCLAGNFNLTNVDEILNDIVAKGQHPRNNGDMFIMLEQIGYLLDKQVERLYDIHANDGLAGLAMNKIIEDELDMASIMADASAKWDGGYVIAGVTGSGDAFAIRDRSGIRPAFYYQNDEIVVVASERPAIQTILNIETEDVAELKAGQGIFIKKNGQVKIAQIVEPRNVAPCSFERIYFSRGSDRDIYRERKMLGRLLVDKILKSIDYDTDHSVFSFIPNTAEVSYYGMIEGLDAWLTKKKCADLADVRNMSTENINRIVSKKIRTEKLAIKDIKLRTFIAENNSRNDMATHVYDITYGTTNPGEDNIIVIDDSIVRGTTLKQSIVKILSRLKPKKLVIVSSSPQVRYPDCYGIDMSKMQEFIAFNAAIDLLIESGRRSVIDDVYRKCKLQESLPKEEYVNYVKEIYDQFTDDEISERIAKMVKPKDLDIDLELVYLSISDLHKACPNNSGDWYFSGEYPTPGGNKALNKAFINYYESHWI